VLNARNDTEEARIVAGAGSVGAVTISTNMAGRGTDIRLGGADEANHEIVTALGGLYVIGTNRHESRRVDQQLRGRAGRQGDPGESRFFVSLEDDLLVRYGLTSLIGSRFVPRAQEDPIDHPVLTREIARVQRIVEGENLEIRKTLCRYASIVEQQRRIVMDWRHGILTKLDAPGIWQRRPEARANLAERWGERAASTAERLATIAHIDRAWTDHLALVADVREGVHLVALGGRDPLQHFTTEITMAFGTLETRIEQAVLVELEHSLMVDGAPEFIGARMKGPSSTWTYLVTDDPFKNQIGMMLTGPGRTTFAIGAAAVAMPLLILWGAIDRVLGKRAGRRPPPARKP
jgi:preprotein translocase subunit SecA